jgi:maltokinase
VGELEVRVASSHPSELLPARRKLLPQGASGVATVLDALDLERDRWVLLLQVPQGLLVSAVVEDGDGFRRAGEGDGVAEGLLALTASEDERGAFAFQRLGEIAEWSGERPIERDQSNESIAVGGKALVKRFVWTALGNERPMVLPAHLVAAGFGEMPAPLGNVGWQHPGGVAPIASIASFLPGARDGWGWYVELLERSLDDRSIDAIEPATALGAITARLHVSLATPTEVLPSPTETASEDTVGQWWRRIGDDLDEALSSVDGDEGMRLRGSERAIRDELRRLPLRPTTAIPLHGDLHVGQFLRWRDGLAVSDLDGDPLGPGTLEGPPAKDVASLVQSLDHVGRIVEGRRDVSVTGWIRDVSDGCLRSYRGELARLGASSLFDEELLRPLRIAQELHEFLYAVRYLPGWRSVPARTIAALLETEA